MNRFVELPKSAGPSHFPLLVEHRDVNAILEAARKSNAKVVEVAAGSITDSAALIQSLRSMLPFPTWCGSSWDSIADAFAELVDLWDFPLLVILKDFGNLLENDSPLALEVVVRLEDLRQSFSRARCQFVPIFESRHWVRPIPNVSASAE